MRHARNHIAGMAALGSLAMFAPAALAADDPEVEALIKPDKTIEFSVGGVMDDARRYNMYTGRNAINGGIDADLNWRDEQSGTWFRILGRNVGQENGDLRLEHEKQGDWRYFFEAGRTVQYNPNIIISRETGVGTNVQKMTGTSLRELDLDLHRDLLKAGYEKKLGMGFSSKVLVKHEEKNGERQWGAQGYNFLTEPVYYQTSEIEGSLAYTGDQLQMNGGYLGSFFRNNDEVVAMNAGNYDISLPPSNQAHQLFLGGGYSFTPSTRGNFKLSYTRNTQDQQFFQAACYACGKDGGRLGGQIDTLVAQGNLAARPLDKLTTNIKLRFEDRNDVTDSGLYRTPSQSLSGLNAKNSHTYYSANFDAAYQLPLDFKLLAGVGYDYKDRYVPPIRSLGYRESTGETTEKIELRRQFLESLGGSIAYLHSSRTGSDYYLTADALTAPDSRVGAILWADRIRDKVRISFDWSPINDLSSQLMLEGSQDRYDGKRLGPRVGDARFASLDMTYKLSRNWNLTGWASIEDTRIEQSTNGDGYSRSTTQDITNVDWLAKLRQIGRAVGLGVRGQPASLVKVGADVEYSRDQNQHEQSLVSPSSVFSISDLPDIKYDQISAKLFGEYEFMPNSGIRMRYNFVHLSAKDWTWQNWAYTDGTSVRIPASQDSHFVGLSYFMKW
jgi:MtrB/PioB family decaheme-associated outer membrane protein